MSTATHEPHVPSLTDAPEELHFEVLESRDARRARLSSGVLIAVVGLLLGVLFFSTSGVARFALSDAFAEVQLPTIELPGAPVVAICAVLCLLAGAGFISRTAAQPQADGGRAGGRHRGGAGLSHLGGGGT